MAAAADSTKMKRRPARGSVFSKQLNSTHMPPLDSLTVLCGQQLAVDCPRIASDVPLPGDVTIFGQGEETNRSTKRLDIELPPLRLKRQRKARAHLNAFPFMKVELAVRNSFPRPQPSSGQTREETTAYNSQPGYHKKFFLHTSSGSYVPGNLSFLCSGSRDMGRLHKDGLQDQDDSPQGLPPGTTSDQDGGDSCRSQPGTDQRLPSPGPGDWLAGEGDNDASSLPADRCGWSLTDGDVMGKNRAATKRQPPRQNARLPATLPSPIRTSQLGEAKPLPRLVNLSQSPRAPHKSKFKVPATAPPISRSQRAARPRDKVEYAEYLPVSGPDDELTDLGIVETIRSPTKKKDKRHRKPVNRDEDLSGQRGSLGSSSSTSGYRKRGSLTYSDDSGQSDDDKKSDISDLSDVSVSALNLDLPTVGGASHLSRTPRMCQVLQAVSVSGTPRRGSKKRDKDYEDEQRRQQLADQRRRKQQQVYNKLRSKPWQLPGDKSDSHATGHASFDNYDFLARYCILNPDNTEAYRQIFDQVDEQGQGWLSQEQTAVALREVNSKLTDTEREFLFRIMELTGYSVTDGADFRLFATLAALSQKITSLDSWMRLMVREMNFQLLEMKTFLCKRLWEVCVDPDTSFMNLEHLMVELRSGGISRRHQEQVRQQLGHLSSLDLVDFLTYSPLFIKIHQAVVENPLSDTGIK